MARVAAMVHTLGVISPELELGMLRLPWSTIAAQMVWACRRHG